MAASVVVLQDINFSSNNFYKKYKKRSKAVSNNVSHENISAVKKIG